MAMEMTEKIDRESVGFIVHEKYEEIVRYLQDALQSSLEDENRFKQKADEIQEMVILLTNSKADRTEIQHMQELMVSVRAHVFLVVAVFTEHIGCTGMHGLFL
jgi:hypothetical protein